MADILYKGVNDFGTSIFRINTADIADAATESITVKMPAAANEITLLSGVRLEAAAGGKSVAIGVIIYSDTTKTEVVYSGTSDALGVINQSDFTSGMFADGGDFIVDVTNNDGGAQTTGVRRLTITTVSSV